MSATDNLSPAPASAEGAPRGWPLLLKKLAIWGLFLGLLYVARDFFFTAFMTFLFCYLTLAVVGWAMKRLSPDRERAWLRRLLILAVFVLTPLALVAIGRLVGPGLLEQGQHLAGWLNQTNPETEVTRLLEGYVGSSQFQREYGGPEDPRYQKGLAEFRATGQRHVKEYQDFPSLEAWLDGSFARGYLEAEQARIRSRLAREGTSSQEFARWFLAEKAPELQAQAKKQVPEKGRATSVVDPLVRAAASAGPEDLLEQVRQDPALREPLRQQWVQDTLQRETAAATGSPAYQESFRRYFEEERAQMPDAIPYTYDGYVQLKKARPQGRKAFGNALEKLRPTPAGEAAAQERADFEAAKKHELFKEWWGTSSTAQAIRHLVEGGAGGDGTGRLERILRSLLEVPVDVGTALLLSLFICIDFPNLKRSLPRLRQTWLRDVYDEMAPALTSLGQLIGRAMHAQGLIAVCNAILMFVALKLLGVKLAVLLSGAVFVLCLVPTLGMVLAWALITVVALIQPGGGAVLGLKVSGAVLLVILMETFIFSPRILGRMMELHPVLVMAILPLGQYFFGVWGLILATPVAVYVIYTIILREALPGSKAPDKPPPAKVVMDATESPVGRPASSEVAQVG
jgi:predicted PurR-regulated permease PerM